MLQAAAIQTGLIKNLSAAQDETAAVKAVNSYVRKMKKIFAEIAVLEKKYPKLKNGKPPAELAPVISAFQKASAEAGRAVSKVLKKYPHSQALRAACVEFNRLEEKELKEVRVLLTGLLIDLKKMLSDLKASKNGKEAAKAVSEFSTMIAAIAPRMKALEKRYPKIDFDHPEKSPAVLRTVVSDMAKFLKEQGPVLRELMQKYENDPDFQKAMRDAEKSLEGD